MSINDSDLKKLYGLSAGKCNICKQGVFENEVHIGEMAHVIAKSESGPRGNEPISSGRNTYDNLILLCRNHHGEVDQNIAKYTVALLHTIKNDHENWVATSLNTDPGHSQDLASLTDIMSFMPFTRIPGYIDNLPQGFDINLFLVGNILDAFPQDRPHCYPFNNLDLQTKYQNFWQSYTNLTSILTGRINNKSIFNQAIQITPQKHYSSLNKAELNFTEREQINDYLATAMQNFSNDYSILITFLRTNYPKLNLDAFKPYPI